MRGLDAGVARARGLATRLVPRERLHELARLPGGATLVQHLAALGYAVDARAEPLGPAETALDAAITRGALARLGSLSRWIEAWPQLAAVLFLEPERRSLRAVLRGDAAEPAPGAPGAEALPTPLLPARRLAELAACRGLTERIAMLARRGHPCGAALVASWRRRGADGFALEVAASRALAERARRAARQADTHLRAFAAEEIDLENAWTLLLLGGSDPDPAREAFLEGGARLPRRRFDALARRSLEDERRAGLARAFSRSALAGVFDDPGVPVSALEARALAARLAAQRRAARVDPLGTAPIVAFALALRAEVADLRRIHWGIAQRLSPEVIAGELVVAS